MPSENKQKIYIVLVIIFFGGVLEILPEQVTTIVPAIFFIWETKSKHQTRLIFGSIEETYD